jgi:hypothetical protein
VLLASCLWSVVSCQLVAMQVHARTHFEENL